MLTSGAMPLALRALHIVGAILWIGGVAFVGSLGAAAHEGVARQVYPGLLPGLFAKPFLGACEYRGAGLQGDHLARRVGVKRQVGAVTHPHFQHPAGRPPDELFAFVAQAGQGDIHDRRQNIRFVNTHSARPVVAMPLQDRHYSA